MEKIKFGVVGTIRGLTFIKLLQVMDDKACLYAVCENDEKNLEKAKADIPEDVKVYSDYDEFLDSGIEAVVLTNFFHEHGSFAIKALKKGIHVLSDTTAAPTLGGCVELCKAVEESSAKYMLGANGIYKKCLQFIKKQTENGKLGTPYYAEAEYLHTYVDKPYEDDDRHWRRYLPGTYYNMHTLGNLMYVTNTVPKTVTSHVVYGPGQYKDVNALRDHDGAKVICEMDNGAVFDVTGCCHYGPTSKWFRIMGANGVLETKRYDETEVLFVENEKEFYPDEEIPEIEVFKPQYKELDMAPKEEFETYTEEQMRIGHGGIDFWLLLNFIKYINGTFEPFFNVYRATALSAAAILGWRSVVNNSQKYIIPDFEDKVEREKYANDFLSPFVEEGSENFYTYNANN